ncbi:MAG: leucine-rich repeat protein, partial [Christensenellales bacterium]
SADNLNATKLNHKNKIRHPAESGTCQDYGKIEYWECPDCGKNFSDEACTAEVSDLQTAKSTHEWEDGACKHCGTSYDDYYFTFTLSSGTYRVTTKLNFRQNGLNGETELIVPSTYKGKAVTEVESYAFRINGLERVVISEGIQKLNKGALSGKDLRSVSLPASLQSFSGLVFQRPSDTNSTLYSVAENLTEIIIADNNVAGLVAENGVVYSKFGDDIAVEAVAPGVTGTLTLPSTVTAIADYAFFRSKLTSVVLPDHLGSIGDYAFQGAAVTELNLADSITSIGKEALSYLKLDTLTLPKVNIVSEGMFRNDKITTIILPEGVTTIEADAFTGVEVDELVIPKSLKEVSKNGSFNNATVRMVYYGGTSDAEFSAITNIDYVWNTALRDSWRKYYSASDTGADNIWHFVDGKPVVW